MLTMILIDSSYWLIAGPAPSTEGSLGVRATRTDGKGAGGQVHEGQRERGRRPREERESEREKKRGKRETESDREERENHTNLNSNSRRVCCVAARLRLSTCSRSTWRRAICTRWLLLMIIVFDRWPFTSRGSLSLSLSTMWLGRIDGDIVAVYSLYWLINWYIFAEEPGSEESRVGQAVCGVVDGGHSRRRTEPAKVKERRILLYLPLTFLSSPPLSFPKEDWLWSQIGVRKEFRRSNQE